MKGVMDSAASSSQVSGSKGPPKKVSKYRSKISVQSIIAEVMAGAPCRPRKKRGREPGKVWTIDHVNAKRKREYEENEHKLSKLVGVQANHGKLISRAVDLIEFNNSKLKVTSELKAKELEKKRLLSELDNLKKENNASEAQAEEAKEESKVLTAGTEFYKDKYIRMCKEMGIQPDIFHN